MIQIPDDIYEQIAEYVRENGDAERESRDYADHYCTIPFVQFESKSIEDLIVEIDGWVSVSYLKSREMWGIELCARGASSCLSCKTWDKDGNDADNDFDDNKLESYFKK